MKIDRRDDRAGRMPAAAAEQRHEGRARRAGNGRRRRRRRAASRAAGTSQPNSSMVGVNSSDCGSATDGMAAEMVGVPERQLAVLQGRAEIAQHRVEMVLRIPGHDRAGQRPGRGRGGPDDQDRRRGPTSVCRRDHDDGSRAGARGAGMLDVMVQRYAVRQRSRLSGRRGAVAAHAGRAGEPAPRCSTRFPPVSAMRAAPASWLAAYSPYTSVAGLSPATALRPRRDLARRMIAATRQDHGGLRRSKAQGPDAPSRWSSSLKLDESTMNESLASCGSAAPSRRIASASPARARTRSRRF